MTGMPGNISGPIESGKIEKLFHQRLASIGKQVGDRIPASTTKQPASTAQQQAEGKSASGKQSGQMQQKAGPQQKAPATGATAADQTQFSPNMRGKLVEFRKQAVRMQHFRDGLEAKFLGFLSVDPSPEQIRQAARFAASTIWDIIKKTKLDEDEDEGKDLSSYLLAMLMKIYSSYTFEHSERVMDWTAAMADALGIDDEQELDDLGKASFFRDIGMIGGTIADLDPESRSKIGNYLADTRISIRECGSLHDIGKTRIPEQILNKTSLLTEEEYAIVKTHPLIGVQIVKPYPSLHGAIPGIRHHHEKWNGAGYPDGLKGKEIPMAARIITITDAFDAMTEDRPYRRGLPYDYAIHEMLRLSGEQFDPELVPVFIKILIDRREADPESIGIAPESIGIARESIGIDPESIGIDPESIGIDPDFHLTRYNGETDSNSNTVSTSNTIVDYGEYTEGFDIEEV